MANVTLASVSKSYGKTPVIPSIDLEIENGEFVVFVGPSGCGKSTLLRMIAGLEVVTSGHLSIAGTVANDIPASKRDVAMVFQSYAIYPHMTVAENLGFGMRVRKASAEEIERRTNEAASALQLESFLDRYPRELSGGQRQRVAIGRAIVRDPGVFLFDEPLSNLDAELRVHMRAEIAQLHRKLSSTMIYVTHDQVEAMTLADRIVVLRDGEVEQVGTPQDLYDNPVNEFVAQFIGSPKMNLLPSELVGDAGGAARIGIRPEALDLTDSTARLSGAVTACEYTGASTLFHVALASGQTVLASVNGRTMFAPGREVGLTFADSDCHRFDAKGVAIG
ncbi:MAG: ABC transporter ATP-binding protein [Pseudomonadota bacterium]